MLNKKIDPKTISYFIFIPALLILIGTTIAGFILIAFGIGSGVNVIQIIPFFLVSLFSITIALITIYIAIRYFRRKPFKENRTFGLLLMVLSFLYFFFTSLEVLISNLTDNEGGWLRPLIAFLFFLIFFPLGLGMKNGYTKNYQK